MAIVKNTTAKTGSLLVFEDVAMRAVSDPLKYSNNCQNAVFPFHPPHAKSIFIIISRLCQHQGITHTGYKRVLIDS